MKSLYFWKTWGSPFKEFYFFLLFLFGLSIAALIYANSWGIEGVVKWEVETELEPVKVVVNQFAKNLFNFTTEAESYYALDKFVTTEVRSNIQYTYIYMSVLMLAVVVVLAIFSYLELYWFMGSMLLFLLFLFSLKLELIEFFGRIDRLTTVAIFLVFSGVCYFFNAFYKSATLALRVIAFLLITVLAGILIEKFSNVDAPFLYMANFGSMFPLCVAILFVLIVGHDIVKGFLFLVSSSKTVGSKNALLNFVFASLLYLVNLLLLLLKKLHALNLDIVYLNPFLLLTISSVIGIWMFRKRTEMFSSVLPFVPAGAYVYLSLAIITFSGISYALINGNIGMVEAYERIIIFGHLFLGFIFAIYVIINFGAFFGQKVSIYENVYKPTRLTYLIVPTLAIAITTFFFLYQRKYPYHLALSGYYSFAGDVMVHESQYPMAFQYYREAVLYDHSNHRANYAIASLSCFLGEKNIAKGYYENALQRDPTVQSYIGLSNAYFESGELFKALFQLKDGLVKFPDDPRLYNNLGVLFHKLNIADSSIHYFLKSKSSIKEKEVPTSNVLYLLAKKNLFSDADSIMSNETFPSSISYLNNKLSISNQLGKRVDESFNRKMIPDSLLNANTFAYLVNFNLNALKDTSKLISDHLLYFSEVSSNQHFIEKLKLQLALKKYYSGNKLEAFNDVFLLESNASSTEYQYSSILGKWFLEEEKYEQAADFFQKASKGGNLFDQINYTIAAAHSGKKDDALFVLNQIVKSPNQDINKLAENLISILSVKNINEVFKLKESERLQFLLIHLTKMNEEQLRSIYNSFENEQAKVYASSAISQLFVSKDKLNLADEILASVRAVPNMNVFATGELNYAELILKTKIKDTDFLIKNVASIPLNADKEMMRSYFIAKTYEYTGDTLNASYYFLKSLSESPYIEFSVSEAIAYLSAHRKEREAYSKLIDILSNYHSTELLKTYAHLCMDMGYMSYAESTIAELNEKLSSNDINELKSRYKRLSLE